ncbi:hypothetical protein K466DRAFT_601392 [Polyporus arcularius HHB13444]|uniref:F-box domain-containing protein n=1 Tax=Polyporus arcularius HHB13444 TaxID=1314778 RepID=A0A5C3P6R8_9APHY|nr:hypothetical protein K466DRAFT_601392 [Polyporus arcularius HHB13444]
MNRVPLPTRSLVPGLPAELSPLIFHHLDAVDLALVRRTNSTWDEYVCAILHRRVYVLISPHVGDYDALAARLLAAGVVIGGFAALHILYPTNPSPPYLELFVPDGADEPLVTYLVAEEGFTVVPRRTQWDVEDEGPGTTVASGPLDCVDALAGPVGSATDHVPVPDNRTWGPGVRSVTVLIKQGFRVYIILSASSPLLPLTAEWHSALFNYVGPVDFCSAYPRLTSTRRALLNPIHLVDWGVVPEGLQEVESSWRVAGWELSADWLPWSGDVQCRGPASSGCAAAQRYFGDRFSASGPVTGVRGRRPEEQRAMEDMPTAYWSGRMVECL